MVASAFKRTDEDAGGSLDQTEAAGVGVGLGVYGYTGIWVYGYTGIRV